MHIFLVLGQLALLALILARGTIFVGGDNPTSIVQPYSGPDPGYILAESNSGLANRLRVLAAYMYIAEAQYEGAHLVFVWDKNHACPGHFLSIFEPIDTLVFATNSSRYVLDKGAKIVYENSFAVFSWIMQMNNIPKNRHGFPTWGEIEYRMYSRYFPVKEVMLKAIAFVNQNQMCNHSAMHLRTTDLDRKMGERKRLHLPQYFHFVESRPVGEKVFLLTDNPATQRLFLQKYGTARILVYNEIADESLQLSTLAVPSSSSLNFIGSGNVVGKRKQQLVEEHRFTSLEHTLIDVIVAAHAKSFKPSPFSSLSELVKMLDYVGKKDRGWCS